MDSDIDRILYDHDRILGRVRELGRDIAAHYADLEAPLTLVPILSGSIIFVADLIRELPLKMRIAMLQLSSYPGTATSPAQDPATLIELTGPVSGRHVLIVDDILDTGNTLRRVRRMLLDRGAASLRTAVLLRKPNKAPTDVPVDFVGFDVEDLFVVGYGLDYNDLYRNYPHIGVLRPELMP